MGFWGTRGLGFQLFESIKICPHLEAYRVIIDRKKEFAGKTKDVVDTRGHSMVYSHLERRSFGSPETTKKLTLNAVSSLLQVSV